MKRSAMLLSTVLAIMTATSCSRDSRIVDWYPVELILQVHDSRGQDLLDPYSEGNWSEAVTITYKGRAYNSSIYSEDQSGETGTKAYLARLYGLRCMEKEGYFGYCLSFGEIDGARNMDEDLVIIWPDGTTNTIHYHCSDHNERKGSCKRWYKLDGVKQDKAYFSFVK